MPRRREVPKREILPDPKYGSGDVAKFVNVRTDADVAIPVDGGSSCHGLWVLLLWVLLLSVRR